MGELKEKKEEEIPTSCPSLLEGHISGIYSDHNTFTCNREVLLERLELRIYFLLLLT